MTRQRVAIIERAWPTRMELARDLSALCGRPVSYWTVKAWEQRGRIPARWHGLILAIARDRGIEAGTIDELEAIVRARLIAELTEAQTMHAETADARKAELANRRAYRAHAAERRRRKVLALWDAGHQQSAIAKQLKLSRQWVSQIIKQHDPPPVLCADADEMLASYHASARQVRARLLDLAKAHGIDRRDDLVELAMADPELRSLAVIRRDEDAPEAPVETMLRWMIAAEIKEVWSSMRIRVH